MQKTAIILIFIINSLIHSQGFTTIPEFPTENDQITITFNIQEMSNSSLIGYTGTLYTHTGVNTNLGNWHYVIGSWGNNSTQPSLTRVDTDTYEITINNVRDFYGITNSSEKIYSLNFVLRSSDGSLQTEDLFVPIYEDGLNIKFVEPAQKNSFIKIGSLINIKAISSLSDSIFLYLDDELVTFSISDSIIYSYQVNDNQRKSFIVIAKNAQQTMADTVYFIGRNDAAIEELPIGLIPGINYISSTNVILALFAPKKEFAYLLGDFNDWVIDSNYQMKLTPDSTIWWMELNDLIPNQEYAFQYVVDGNIIIADPYADKVLIEIYDDEISEFVYPDLKPYPKNKTTEIVSVFQTDQVPYEWEVEQFERPRKEDLVIYELLVRDFIEDHSFKSLKDTLSYLHDLGVNAIELMPVMEFARNNNWGYEPYFQFAVDKYYGTKNDLKDFIDECHKLGIAVILDVVLNHVYGQSPFVRLYNEGGYSRPTPDNPWLNPEPTHPFNVGYDFNHESPHTKELVDRFNKYWLQEFNIDGFRFDLTKGMTQTFSGNDPSLMAKYDQSRINILTRMGDRIKEYDSTAYLILEHFADNSEEKVLADYGFMIWGNLNYEYNEATMGYTENGKSDLSWGSYKERGWSKPHLVTYMESHDEERLMFKNLAYGNLSGQYSIKDTTTALNRMKLASAFFYTIPGPKMIWKFGELGYDYSKFYDIYSNMVVPNNDAVKLDRKPIRWDYLDDPNRMNLFKVNRALISLKKNYDVFRTDDFSLNVGSYVKRIKLTHESMNVTIIGNFDVIDRQISPAFHNSGTWYDYFSGDSIEVVDIHESFLLSPGEFHIYTDQKLPTPEADILLNSDLQNDQMPSNFNLNQNYPNPFNPVTNIAYTIPSNYIGGGIKVDLIIYDVLGRVVAKFDEGLKKPGTYEIQFNGSNFSSGIYFYSISAGDFRQTKKMILMK